ncbi:MAG TPA: hypothetical protein VJ372_05430 [Pyrinomonadaceae bacterium]|nr:hypothetical protein [Pyrinomonadaceae bacterium]
MSAHGCALATLGKDAHLGNRNSEGVAMDRMMRTDDGALSGFLL